MTAAKTRRDYRHATTGAKLSGTTTVLGLLDLGKSGGMAHAAWKLGMGGQSYSQVWGEKRDTGSLAHVFIEQTFAGVAIAAPDDDVSKTVLAKALRCLDAFERWRAAHVIEVLGVEVPLVDSQCGFGGTIDLVARIDGVVTIADWKSGAVRKEMILQAAAYSHLWNLHHDVKVEQAMLVHLPPDGSDPSEVVLPLTLLQSSLPIFCALLAIHQTKSVLKLPKSVNVNAGGF